MNACKHMDAIFLYKKKTCLIASLADLVQKSVYSAVACFFKLIGL